MMDTFRKFCFVASLVIITADCQAPEAHGSICTRRSTQEGSVRLNYTLRDPMGKCQMKDTPQGATQTIPKLMKVTSHLKHSTCGGRQDWTRLGHQICRIPDCSSHPCVSGWCEETAWAYLCHCPHDREGTSCEIIKQTHDMEWTTPRSESPTSVTPERMENKSVTMATATNSTYELSTLNLSAVNVSPSSSSDAQQVLMRTNTEEELVVKTTEEMKLTTPLPESWASTPKRTKNTSATMATATNSTYEPTLNLRAGNVSSAQNLTTATMTTEVVPGRCQGFTLESAAKCYWVDPQHKAKTWKGAKKHCREISMDDLTSEHSTEIRYLSLLTLDTQQELVNFLQRRETHLDEYHYQYYSSSIHSSTSYDYSGAWLNCKYYNNGDTGTTLKCDIDSDGTTVEYLDAVDTDTSLGIGCVFLNYQTEEIAVGNCDDKKQVVCQFYL